jgi:NADPH:quinone reductase-like Zn-dependent oxidoreductase
MRAILRTEFGGPEVLVIREIPEPEPKEGHAVIEVKAFGLNHAELHMRKGEWAEIADVSGIECVGVVKSCPGGEFPVGAKVAALMGGLGRTINGSYAEFTRAPASNVALIESDLPWADLAALPETFTTAWTCLFRNLEIQRGQTPERLDAVLDLVGNSTILDSLRMLRRSGRACLAGWLGGLAPIADFNPLLQMASGVYLTFFGSFVFGTPGFPLSDVPLQKIAEDVAAGRLEAKPSRVFRFDEVREAHRVMEANEAGGKMVVVHD